MNWTKTITEPPVEPKPREERWKTEHDGWTIEVKLPEGRYYSGHVSAIHPAHGHVYLSTLGSNRLLPSLGNVAEILKDVLDNLQQLGVDLRCAMDREVAEAKPVVEPLAFDEAHGLQPGEEAAS